MPKVAAVGVMVKVDAAVAPSADAVTVAEPASAPATVTVSVPFAPVVPDAGVSVTLPVPDLANVTAAPEIVLPPASLAVIVRVAGDAPLSTRVLPVVFTVTVEPTI